MIGKSILLPASIASGFVLAQTPTPPPGQPFMCWAEAVPSTRHNEANQLALRERPSNALGHPTLGGALPMSLRPTKPSLKLSLLVDKFWENGRTLRVRFLNGNSNDFNLVQKYVAEWRNVANIKFLFGNYENSDIRIEFNRDNVNESWIGTDAKSIGQDVRTMSLGWAEIAPDTPDLAGVVLHEFGHALGAIHEHQSPSANMHWIRNNLNSFLEAMYGITLTDKIFSDNFLPITAPGMQRSTPLDLDSVMNYDLPAYVSQEKIEFHRRYVLSPGDRKLMGENYPFSSIFSAYPQDGKLTASVGQFSGPQYPGPTNQKVVQTNQGMTGQPATATFFGRLYVAYLDGSEDRRLCLTSTADGQTFTEPYRFPDTTRGSTPAMAVSGGKLHIAFRGRADFPKLVVRSTSDGVHFDPPMLRSGMSMGSAPGLVSFDGHLITAFQAADSSHYLYVSAAPEGGQFPPTADRRPLQIGSAPALMPFKGRLYVAYKGDDDDLVYIASADSWRTSFGNRATTIHGAVTNEAPSLAVLNDHLYMFYRKKVGSSGQGGELAYRVSPDGNTFYGPYNWTTSQVNGPAATTTMQWQ